MAPATAPHSSSEIAPIVEKVREKISGNLRKGIEQDIFIIE